MTDERHRQVCGSDAFSKKTKSRETKEEEGRRGAQEKYERGQ